MATARLQTGLEKRERSRCPQCSATCTTFQALDEPCHQTKHLRSIPMKVLHVIGGSIHGGAAKAVRSLHRAQRAIGIDSTIACGENVEPEPHEFLAADSLVDRLLTKGRWKQNRLRQRLRARQSGQFFSLSLKGLDLPKILRRFSPDILHLPWAHGGVADLRQLPDISIPIVWSLRDLWWVTGGCHYPTGCEGYKQNCDPCQPLSRLGPYHRPGRQLHAKRDLRARSDITFVPVSSWTKRKLVELGGWNPDQLRIIPSCIDEALFTPVDQAAARKTFGLPAQAKVVAMGAQNLQDGYKGAGLIRQIVQTVPQHVHLLIFGHGGDQAKIQRGQYVGYVESLEKMRQVYGAADVFLGTSLEETFGKTSVEALACGTPVVGFEDNGVLGFDLDKRCFRRTKTHTATEFWEAAESLLAATDQPAEISAAARNSANQFRATTVARAHFELYEELHRANS